MTFADVVPPQPCVGCGRPTDPYARDTLYGVRGFAQRRRGGGLHALTFKIETGELMCGQCVRVKKDTGMAQQESFF